MAANPTRFMNDAYKAHSGIAGQLMLLLTRKFFTNIKNKRIVTTV